jgi:hypothetical protein
VKCELFHTAHTFLDVVSEQLVSLAAYYLGAGRCCMRLTIACAACLICVASFAPNAQTEIVGMTTTVKKTFGCPSYDGFKEVMVAGIAGNPKKAHDLAVQYQCVMFDEGETVTIMRERVISICVKPLDDSACYWIPLDKLQRSD